MKPFGLIILGLLGCASARAGLLPDMSQGVPGEFAQRRAGVEVSATVKIGITNDGLYRVTYSNLTSVGISNPVGNQIRLFCQTQEVAIYVSNPGAMTASDYLLFYGVSFNGSYSSSNAYWLGLGGGGLRMTEQDASPIPSGLEITSSWHTVIYQPDKVFVQYHRPMDTNIDRWVAAVITTNAGTYFPVHTDHRLTNSTAIFDFLSYGGTADAINPDHQTQVAINGKSITNFLSDGDSTFYGACTFPASYLSNGFSTVSLQEFRLPGVLADLIYMEDFSIRYLRSLTATNNELDFRGYAGSNNYSVVGFNISNGLWILNVSQPMQPVHLINYGTSSMAGGYGLRFGDNSLQTNHYYIGGPSNFLNVGSLERVVFRNLAATNRQADYIVICPYEFRRQTYRLLKHRRLNGLNVVVAPITDIYNEFSYGIRDADAIKQFLGYAFWHWAKPEPRYVLFVGDGRNDPKNNLGSSTTKDWVPVHLGPTYYQWTALEGWFATVHGSDRLADMAIGRIPAGTESTLSNVVSKIITYEGLSRTNAWRKRALLVADNDEPVSGLYFTTASENRVYAHITNICSTIQKPYLDWGYTPDQARTTIMNGVNAGRLMVSYFGHGSYDLWATENIFNTNDVITLTNSVWPLFVMLTCRNGDFDQPQVDCLAETLLGRSGRGSIACVAADTLSEESHAELFADGFFQAFGDTNQYPRVGDQMLSGDQNLWGYLGDVDELLFYTLFGDPALVLHPSQ